MSVLLAVNGTLMRGLELCKNMEDAGAEFVKEDATAPCYRLWSVNDNNPAMLKDFEILGDLFNIEPNVIKVVPVIIPRYPLNIVLGTTIVSVISAEFFVHS